MWVKTQDGKQLLDINRFAVTKYNSSDVVEISGFTTGVSTYIDLGSYSTEEKAMRVLDDIAVAVSQWSGIMKTGKSIYIMPKKDY